MVNWILTARAVCCSLPFWANASVQKTVPLAWAEMTADFVNAYILGSVGATGANVGGLRNLFYTTYDKVSPTFERVIAVWP